MSFKLLRVEPARPITIDSKKCVGCLSCVNACPIDLMMPPEKKGDMPVIAYPDECWYCGACAMECPTDAIVLKHPLMNQPRWVDKDKLKGKGGYDL